MTNTITKTDGNGVEHEIPITEQHPSSEDIERAEARNGALFRRVLGANASAAEKRRKIINRHKVECNDLEGMDPDDVAAIQAADARRARRAAKLK